MRKSDALQLVEPGTLIRPGPIGRLVRLALGVLCLFAFGEVIYYWQWSTSEPFSTLDNRFVMVLAPLCVFNYVVNIGFGKSWGYRPLTISVLGLVVMGCIAYLISGALDSPILGVPLNLWLGYFYGHLGLSFVVAAILATPGCEMRAIPDLAGRVRGAPSEEHHCPAAFITKIDAWEHGR